MAPASRSTLPLPLLPNTRPLFAGFSPTGTSHCARRPPSARWIPHVLCRNLHHTLLATSFHYLPSHSRVLMLLWMAGMPEENPGSSENSVCSSVLFQINFWHGRKAKQGLCLAMTLAYFYNCEKVTQTLESSVPVWKKGIKTSAYACWEHEIQYQAWNPNLRQGWSCNLTLRQIK